jgi:hypothetical protein
MSNPLHRIISNPAEGSTTASVALTAGPVLIYAPWRPIRIVRWGMVCVTTVNDTTNALKLTCDLRPTAGSSTGQVTGASTLISAQTGWNASTLPQLFYDTKGGSITLTASASQVAAGQAIYHEVGPQAPSAAYSPYYPDPDTAFDAGSGVATGFLVYPGQEVVITSQATAPATGAGKFFLEVDEQAFAGSGDNNRIVVTGIPSILTPTPSDPGVWTRYLN